MEFTPEIMQKIVAASGALLGALTGGIFSLIAGSRAAKREVEKERRREEKEVQNLLDALGVEMGTLWGFHMRRIGPMIEALQPEQAVELNYPLTQDYFTVYHMNADKLGQVKNQELRESIVVTYNKAKKVVDGFKYNNELYKEYLSVLHSPHEMSNKQEIAQAWFGKLCWYGQIMKEDHFELKGYVENMLALLEKAATTKASVRRRRWWLVPRAIGGRRRHREAEAPGQP